MGSTSRKYGLLSQIILAVLFANQKPVYGQELRMGFCHASDFVNIEYQAAMGKSILRFMAVLDPNFTSDIRYTTCASTASSSFYGSPEAVFGREEAMAMMVETAYWSASMYAVQQASMPNGQLALSDCCKLDWIDAYRLAKARLYFEYEELEKMTTKVQAYLGFSANQMEQLADLVEELHYTENNFWLEGKTHSDFFVTAYPFYKALIDNLTSFIIGHELFHFNDNNQMIVTKSLIEENGLFNIFYGLQQYKRLLDPYLVNSDKDEINADKSGLRFLQLMDSNTGNQVSDRLTQTAIRKYTIDLLAYPTLAGFDLTGLDYDSPAKTAYYPGYLYPMIRMMMITAVLQSNESQNDWAVKMCGNTSKAIVTLIETYSSAYNKSDGDVPDEVLSLLPGGVTAGWETNEWNDSSFLCKKSN